MTNNITRKSLRELREIEGLDKNFSEAEDVEKVTLKVVINPEAGESYTLSIPTTIPIRELAIVTQKFAQLLKQFRGDVELTTRPDGMKHNNHRALRNPKLPREVWLNILRADYNGDLKTVEALREEYEIKNWDDKIKEGAIRRLDIQEDEYKENSNSKHNGNGILKSKTMKGGFHKK